MTTDRINEIQLETPYPESVLVQQALLKVWNEVAQEHKLQHLTDKDMETLSTRITPSFYDIVLDGVDKSKTDILRKLRIIINDIITTKQKGNSMENTEVNKSYAEQLVDEYFDNYKTEKPSESDLPMILSIVEFMLKKFYYVTDGSEQTTAKTMLPIEYKYIVIKKEHLNKLGESERTNLLNLIDWLGNKNSYWVCNQDEPYADRVRDIILSSPTEGDKG